MDTRLPMSKLRAFTIVEMVVALLILSILVSLGVVAYSRFIGNASDVKASSNLRNLITLASASSLSSDNEGEITADESSTRR